MAPAQIKRRAFMSLIAGVAAWPVAARAQQSERVRRLGLLQGLAADDPEWQRRFGAFKQGLQDLGWTEGQNITFEGRFADGKPERLGALAAELVAANVDVIVTNAAQSIEAARKATSTIPIVMASVGDALGAGYVASLARPGANVTGLTLVATDQSAKRLQLLKEMVPNLVRVALFWNADASGHRLQLQEMELAAPGLGMRLQSLALHTGEEIDASLQAAMRANAQAFFTMDDPLILSQRTRILDFATRQRGWAKARCLLYPRGQNRARAVPTRQLCGNRFCPPYARRQGDRMNFAHQENARNEILNQLLTVNA
jgi:putative tryptophan/tyrosine transport system substrate-binding protein